MAFMHKLEFGDHVSAELWGILLGLKTTWDQGKRRVVLESDAQEVLNSINSGNCRNHPNATIIEEIRLMVQSEWRIELQFVPRNANRAADYLAKEALSTVTGFHPILYSTLELAAVLELDQRTPTDVG